MRSCSKRLIPVLVCGLVASGLAQDAGRSVRHRPVAVAEDPASNLLDQAETLLSKGDAASAKPLLEQATQKNPKSYQAWYDLGYAEQVLNEHEHAIAAYRKSLEINPKVFEANLNLGMMLASAGQKDEGAKYLKAATELQPASHPERSKEHAWLALGQTLLAGDSAGAEQAFLSASKLSPKDPQPHLLLGELYENSGKLDQAKAQYQQSLSATDPRQGEQALRGLVNIAVASKQYGEAETNVRQYLATTPNDSQAHLLLGRLLAAQGKNDEALHELDAAGNQNDPAVLREKAELLSAVHRESDAIPIYKLLVSTSSNDAQLRYEYGLALMHEHHWVPAEEQLLAAVKLNPNLAPAYGDLAVVASDNQQYDLTLKALEIRTKLLGDNPGTFFLRATALDHLRRFPEATENYRQFLAAANGKYPDEEWKARHRLIAIEKLK
jgi:tetratricopeptide (TPR) repeat protein